MSLALHITGISLLKTVIAKASMWQYKSLEWRSGLIACWPCKSMVFGSILRSFSLSDDPKQRSCLHDLVVSGTLTSSQQQILAVRDNLDLYTILHAIQVVECCDCLVY